MNLFLYTTELTAANAHLMPWRTILEIARVWQAAGHRVRVLSGAANIAEESIGDVRVLHVIRPKAEPALEAFASRLRSTAEGGKGTLFFPVAPGSDYSRMAQRVEEQGIAVVWYYPGAWYGKRQVITALRVLPFKRIWPYFIQAYYPKGWWLNKLGGRPLIAMTPFTARKVLERGYKGPVTPIYPGKAPVEGAERSTQPRSAEFIGEGQPGLRAAGAPYFLFFGPPDPIRGVLHILDAFTRLLKKQPDCRLVCLFRGDANVDRTALQKRAERLRLGDRLITVWESVSACQLSGWIAGCRAVLKPFVLVPSEIPLAVIEALEYEKPVIGFNGDGTGEFIGQFGLLARHGSAKDLSEKMRLLLEDAGLYEAQCEKAKAGYAQHPGWARVAEDWFRAANG